MRIQYKSNNSVSVKMQILWLKVYLKLTFYTELNFLKTFAKVWGHPHHRVVWALRFRLLPAA